MGLIFRTDEGDRPYVPPKDKYELQSYLQLFFGITLAARAVCPEHDAPLDAAWAAYKADESIIVCHASRGLGGKSTLIGALTALEGLDGCDVTVLGGSARQSKRVHDVESGCWTRSVTIGGRTIERPFWGQLAAPPSGTMTKFKAGNLITALPASSKSVRGPHPQRLRLDEVDEMKLAIFDASLGQPMGTDEHRAQTLISSTHQYPAGTFTEVLKRAKERGWPLFQWCYLENLKSNGGWLDAAEVERKRATIDAYMWATEFELQEPAPEGRIFGPEQIEAMFDSGLGYFDDSLAVATTMDEEPTLRVRVFEPYQADALYATGVDWAKERDFTVIVTLRYDCFPARVVAYARVNREPWQLMADRLDDRVKEFGGTVLHDAIGIGNVVKDLLLCEPEDYIATGRARTELYSAYQVAVESGRIRSPEIEAMKREHRYCTIDDLYGSGHVPDTLCAMALAWFAASGRVQHKQPKKRPAHLGKMTRF